MEMKDLVTDVRLFPPRSKQTKVLASGYMILGGLVKVSMAIVRNVKGNPWLVLPYHEDGDGNRYNDVEGINREAGDSLKAVVMGAFEKFQKEGNEFDQTAEAAAETQEGEGW